MSIFFHYGSFKTFIKRCPVTFIIILANTAMLIATIITSLSYGANLNQIFNTFTLFKLGGLIPFLVTNNGEYYRLFTAMFLHGNTLHFLFNTFFGILIISGGFEKLVGSLKFLVLYIGSGLISSLIITAFSDPESITIGASGAIFGVMGAFLYIILREKNMLSLSDQVYIRNLLIINLIFTFFAPGISIAGHIGGLIGGFSFGFLVLRSKGYEYY